MAKINKWNYFRVIQQNYGQGFEDVSSYTCNSKGITSEKTTVKVDGKEKRVSLLSHDLKEYRYKCQYPTRVIFRKELAAKN